MVLEEGVRSVTTPRFLNARVFISAHILVLFVNPTEGGGSDVGFALEIGNLTGIIKGRGRCNVSRNKGAG